METLERMLKVIQNNGFQKVSDNSYEKQEKITTGKMIVNGQEQVQQQEVTIGIEYLGEGYITSMNGDKTPTYGFRLILNGQQSDDFWMMDEKELNYYFKMKIE